MEISPLACGMAKRSKLKRVEVIDEPIPLEILDKAEPTGIIFHCRPLASDRYQAAMRKAVARMEDALAEDAALRRKERIEWNKEFAAYRKALRAYDKGEGEDPGEEPREPQSLLTRLTTELLCKELITKVEGLTWGDLLEFRGMEEEWKKLATDVPPDEHAFQYDARTLAKLFNENEPELEWMTLQIKLFVTQPKNFTGEDESASPRRSGVFASLFE